MNYEKIYNDLMLKRRLNPVKVGYKEKHHILPKSLYPEFKDLKAFPWNRVDLTAREHYIAHRLLTKFITVDVWKMHHAVWKMACTNQSGELTIGSREYEILRINHASAIGKNEEANKKKRLANKGKKQSHEHIAARVASRKKSPWFTEETKKRIGVANRGPKPNRRGIRNPDEAIEQMRQTRIERGSFRTPEKRAQDRAEALERKNSTLTCPHCGFISTPYGKRQMTRWHFDNCRNKEGVSL